MSLKIQATRDVPDEVLAAEPPSWITFIANLDWWQKILGSYAAIYLASIASAAGKETWEKKTAIVGYIKDVAKSILSAKEKSNKNTKTELALILPGTSYEAKLHPSSEDIDSFARELALFVSHAPDVVDVYRKNIEYGNQVVGWVQLTALDDGGMEVKWMDGESLETVIHVLPPKSP